MRWCVPAARILALCGLFGATVGAAADDFAPSTGELCGRGRLNKEKFADYLLWLYPLSVQAVEAVGLKGKVFSHSELLANAFKNLDVCKPDESKPKERKCAPSDHGNIGEMEKAALFLIDGYLRPDFDPQFPRGEVNARAYFEGDYSILCAAPKPDEGDAADDVTPRKRDESKFRLRGDPTQLLVDRSQKAAFGDTDKATLSTVRDDIAGTRSSNILLYVGYPIKERDRNDDWYEIVPYAGINRTVVNPLTGSQAGADYSDSNAYGVILGGHKPLGSTRWSYDYQMRPELLVDHAEGSRLASLNLQVTPILHNRFNDHIRGMSDLFVLKLIFVPKFNIGRYVDRGKPDAEADNKDYTRTGADVGFSGQVKNPSMPIDFSSRYTKLWASHDARDVSYVKTSINWNLHPKKYFGIGVNVSHGIREDTAKDEHKKEIVLTIRY